MAERLIVVQVVVGSTPIIHPLNRNVQNNRIDLWSITQNCPFGGFLFLGIVKILRRVKTEAVEIA